MFNDYCYSASQKIIPMSAFIIDHLAIIDAVFKEYVTNIPPALVRSHMNSCICQCLIIPTSLRIVVSNY